jgi:hypothetical protein
MTFMRLIWTQLEMFCFPSDFEICGEIEVVLGFHDWNRDQNRGWDCWWDFDSFEEFHDESEVEVVDEILIFQDEKVSILMNCFNLFERHWSEFNFVN